MAKQQKESLFKRMRRWPETTYAANIVGAQVLPFLPNATSLLAWGGEYARHVPVISTFARLGLGGIALYNGYEGVNSFMDFSLFGFIDAAARGAVAYHSGRGACGYGVKR